MAGALSASLMTLLVMVVVLLPVVVLAMALSDDIADLGTLDRGAGARGPADAPSWLVSCRWSGLIAALLAAVAHNGERLMQELAKLSEPAQDFALGAGGTVGGVIDIALSVFLAFFLYLHGEALARRVSFMLERLSGERAPTCSNSPAARCMA